jgi:hypothetical protein
MVYALGATQPHFQMKDTATFTADARWVFRCQAGELERVHVPDEARTSFGACIATSLLPSDDGRYVAQPMGDHLRVVREDGLAVRLAALGAGADLVAYAVDEATGRYVAFNATGGDELLRYRQPGPATTAALVPLGAAASAADPQLLQRFFGL